MMSFLAGNLRGNLPRTMSDHAIGRIVPLSATLRPQELRRGESLGFTPGLWTLADEEILKVFFIQDLMSEAA